MYVGPQPEAPRAFVIDQLRPDGSFDEHKVMLGYPNAPMAAVAYRAHIPAGAKVGKLTGMPLETFRQWLKTGDVTQPVKGAAAGVAASAPVASIRAAMQQPANAAGPVPHGPQAPGQPGGDRLPRMAGNQAAAEPGSAKRGVKAASAQRGEATNRRLPGTSTSVAPKPGMPRGDERARTQGAPLSFEDRLVLRGDASRAKIVQAIGNAAQPSIKAILDLDPKAKIGFRGSLVDGLKNATKLGKNGERVAFDGIVATKNGLPYKDPQGYDVDFFIVSDVLAAQFKKRNPFFKDAIEIEKSLKGKFKNFGKTMRSNPVLSGMKFETPVFRVYSGREMVKKSGSQYYFLLDEKNG